MPDYKNGKIYAIRSHQTEQIYIGSTTQTLPVRFGGHKRTLKFGGVTCKSNIILQYQDAYIELIELFPCNSKEELNKKEGEHIRLNNCVNRCIAGRTKQEYFNENKEYFINKQKERHANPEKREHDKAQRKQYYEENHDKIREREKILNKTPERKAIAKAWEEKNKEKRNRQAVERRALNKQKIIS